MDYFTKWPEAYATPDQQAPKVADALVTNFFCRFGMPRELYGDQDRNFQSLPLQEILQRLGVGRAPLPSTRSRTAWWNGVSTR
jgi:hypothetical protein